MMLLGKMLAIHLRHWRWAKIGQPAARVSRAKDRKPADVLNPK
jgi:hypothetical protein